MAHNYFCFREQWSSPRGKWWCNSQSNTGAAGPGRLSWHPPADSVCTRLSPSGHRARSCDTQLNQGTPFQKGPVSTERGQWQRLLPAQLQAAAVKNLPVPFWGDAREDYPPDSMSYVEQCQEYHSSAFNHNLGFEIQTSPRSSLPAPWLSFQSSAAAMQDAKPSFGSTQHSQHQP